MKVNVNGVWHDAKEIPIQIQLSKSDKNNIANMHEDKFNYICFPDGMKKEDVEKKLSVNNPIDGGSSLETLTQSCY